MKDSTKKAVFLALTQVHRSIVKGEPVYWYPTFKAVGITNPNIAKNVKEALIKMQLIKCYSNHRMGWNKNKTLPSMQLIEGIALTIKELQKSSKVPKVKLEVKPKVKLEVTTTNSLNNSELVVENWWPFSTTLNF